MIFCIFAVGCLTFNGIFYLDFKPMKIQFISLGSGSSGNCYYLGTPTYGILIDAGISARQIRKSLKAIEVELEQIHAVFITHDHADHIKAVGHLGEKLHIPIYSTAQVHAGINLNKCMRHTLTQCVRTLEKEETFSFKDFSITPFEVPHDGTDNVGYCIEVDGKTFTFATDLGEITPTVASYLKKANYLILEANYEEEMLRMGRYPQFLKERVASSTGHLSNQAAADFLAQNYQSNWKHIWLCHLSKDNNHPELAYKTVESQLRNRGVQVGIDLELVPLKRTLPSELYIL